MLRLVRLGRRAGREPPTRQARGARAGARRPHRPQPPAGDHPGQRLRPGRALRLAARLRHAGRGHVGLRRHQRRARRPARCCRPSPSPTRSPRWSPPSPPWSPCTSGVGPGRRRQPARVAVPADGPAAVGLRRARLRAAPARARASPTRCPRSTYRTADDRWVAVSTSAESVARRVLDLIGVGDDERLPHLRRPGGPPRRGRRGHGRAGSAPATSTRCWPSSRPPTPPPRR